MALLRQSQDERLKLLERRLTGQELSKDACEQLTTLLLSEASQEALAVSEPGQSMDRPSDVSKRRQSKGSSSPRKKRRTMDAVGLDAASPSAARPASAESPSIGALAHSYRAGCAPVEEHIPASPPPGSHQRFQHRDYRDQSDEQMIATDVEAGPTQQQQAACQTHPHGALKPKQLQKNKIDRYFPSHHPPTDAALLAELQQLRQDKERMILATAQLQQEVGEAQAAASAVEQKLHDCREAAAERERKAAAAMLRLAGKKAQAEGQLGALQLQQEGLRLGRLSILPSGPLGSQEVWEDGQAFRDLAAQSQAIALQRETIEAARKAARKKLLPPTPLAARPANQLPEGQRSTPAAKPPSPERMAPEEYVAMEEVFKVKLGALKREEERLAKEQERLDFEKARHIRELKRRSEEDSSRFSGHQVLKQRYLLLHLLGKGGFSEVFKAFDTQSLQEVAVKVHQLNVAWPTARKAAYVRHAVREYEIHKCLRHTNIVALLDIFEIDANTFATVLELCTGGDLDTYLKENQVLPEKEARVIAAQVKITDFGLCKIVEDWAHSRHGADQAGRWHLLVPAARVLRNWLPSSSHLQQGGWSGLWGSFLFQMLFGRRPFGEGSSQEATSCHDDIILHAKSVSIPTQTCCLCRSQGLHLPGALLTASKSRLDVQAAAGHAYMALKRPKTTPAKHD
ncbi:hypothetical protein WJX84_000682 [Apatococcus fuscideae]|uniref:Protein kinase domain-containing protein n=1 Tax=Apatococcus fuscideae TaxID=2026836 RepID=A0AAW1T0I2_9CHLO